jgi:hypothetical protein
MKTPLWMWFIPNPRPDDRGGHDRGWERVEWASRLPFSASRGKQSWTQTRYNVVWHSIGLRETRGLAGGTPTYPFPSANTCT